MGWADGYIAVVVSGQGVGKFFDVRESGSDFLVLGRATPDKALPSSGEKMIVTTGYFENAISGNAVYGAGTYGIGLWGSSWWNSITDNVVAECQAGLEAASVITGGASGVQAYSGCNSLVSNVIIRRQKARASVALPTHAINVLTKVYGGGDPLLADRNPLTRIEKNTVKDPTGVYVVDAWRPIQDANETQPQ
jgi:hypothetical protein